MYGRKTWVEKIQENVSLRNSQQNSGVSVIPPPILATPNQSVVVPSASVHPSPVNAVANGAPTTGARWSHYGPYIAVMLIFGMVAFYMLLPLLAGQYALPMVIPVRLWLLTHRLRRIVTM